MSEICLSNISFPILSNTLPTRATHAHKVLSLLQNDFIIGGNVLNSVSLSALKAETSVAGLSPSPEARLSGARRWFAHLQLQTGAIEADALDHTPTITALQR